MVNFNGTIQPSDTILSTTNRAFLYGDGVFETLKIVNGKILFFEDHYFRLMASMRIVRMQIPDNFTLEYVEEQILNLTLATNCNRSARVRFTVYRNDRGFYLPTTRTVSFIIQAYALENTHYSLSDSPYEVDLYKDFFIPKHLLSTVKTTNKMVQVTGSIFAHENELQNCLLVNNDKNVVEALNGNVFMLMGNTLITPAIEEGCLNGIMRKQVLALARKMEKLEVVESVISPFDLQKADELFITNMIIGIQPVTKYRKKEYKNEVARALIEKINALI